MATERKDIELILRAKDLGSQPFKDVASAVEKVTQALDEQTQAARRGDASAAELRDSLKQLEQAGQALLKQQSLIDLYRKVGEQLTAAQSAAAKSRHEFEAFAAQMAATGEATKKQQKDLAAMQKSADGADKKVATLTATLGAQHERLTQAGIDTKNLETAQVALVNTAQRTGTAMSALSGTIDGYNANLRKMRDAERQVAETNAFNKKFEEAQQLQKSASYVAFWTQQIEQMEVKERQAAEQQALQQKAQKELQAFRQLADQAIATARGYNTLGDASVKLAQASSQVAPSIRAILDPAGAARDSIGGLEKQINDMGAAITGIRGPVTDYTGTLKQLQAAQRAVGNQAEAIDGYRQQIAVVRAARKEFMDARADMQQYAAAIKSSTVPNAELAEGLRRSQAALAATQRQMQSQVDTARQMQQALRQAGVSTAQLASEEERLTGAARTSVTATEQLAAAYKRYGDAADNAGKKTKSINEGSRESLSWYQRVRGEIIALATAYIGLQGAIGLAKGAIESYISKQAVENRLAIVVGNDPVKIAQEWDYVHAQALRLGVGINELADAYSRFGIAAKNGNLTADQTRFAFERISEVLRVNHASTEQVSGAFYQLEQMLSKNRIGMDDLRQASNWIPGLETMMAKGLGMVNVQQLFEQMKKGAVDAKTAILGLAQEMQREYGERVPEALKSLQAEQGRFKTSVSDFQRMIANNGFAAAYTALLQKLTALMSGEQGTAFANSIAKAFSAVVAILSSLADHSGQVGGLLNSLATILNVVAKNIDIIIPLMEMAFGLKVLGWVSGLVLSIGAAATKTLELAAATRVAGEATAATGASAAAAAAGTGALAQGAGGAATAVSLLGIAIKGITRFLGLLGLALIVWDIATIFYDKFEGVRKVVDSSAVYIVAAFKNMQLQVGHIFGLIADDSLTLGQKIKNGLLAGLSGVASLTMPTLVGKPIADKLRSGMTQPAGSDSLAAQEAAIAKERDTKLANIAAGRKPNDDGTSKANTGPSQSQLAAYDALTKKETEINDIVETRSKMIDEIRVKLAAGELSQKQAEEATTKAFQSFGPQIKEAANNAIVFAKNLGSALPVDKFREFVSKMEGLRGIYEPNLHDDKDEEKKAKKRETLERNLAESMRQIDAKTERQQKDSLEARLKAIDDTYQKMFVHINEFKKVDGSEIDGVPLAEYQQRLEAAKDVLKTQETAKFNTEELKKKEQAVNDAVAERSSIMKAIADQVSAGQISAAEGYKRSHDEAAKLQPKIKALADEAERFAQNLKGQGIVPDTKIDALTAKMGKLSPGASSAGASADLLRQFEGFQPTGKWDRTAFRAGFGSDTVTLADGSIQKVTEGMKVSMGDATRDLTRRVEEFQGKVKAQVGEERFNMFSPQQQAALTSVAYNYGSLPDRIIGAVKTGSADEIADAVRKLAGDNGGINKGRRNKEADIIQNGGASAGTSPAQQMSAIGMPGSAASGQPDAQTFIKQQYQDLNNVISERNALVQTYNQLVQLGSMTEADAQTKIQEAYARTQPVIKSMADEMSKLLNLMMKNGDITAATFDKWSAQLSLVEAQSQKVDANFVKIKDTLTQSITSGAVTAFDSIGQSLAGAIDKSKSWGDAMKDIGRAALTFAADMLKNIANLIIQMTIMNALKNSSAVNSTAGFFSSMFSSAAVSHTGSVVGTAGGASRSVPSSWFANAPRYHDGTVVGLKSDERTAILQTGEEVLTRDDPRNIMNANKNGSSAPASSSTPRIINVLDPSLVQDHLSSSAGEDVLVNVIRRNAGSIKQILGNA